LVSSIIKGVEVKITNGQAECGDRAVKSLVVDLLAIYETQYHGYEPEPDAARLNWIMAQLADSPDLVTAEETPDSQVIY
jgi:hypothetical protein